MQLLFPNEPYLPDGFSYYPQYINSEEEQKLCEIIEQFQLQNFQFQGYEAHRKVASFGYDYDFTAKVLRKGKEIPNDFNWLLEKVASKVSLKKEEFAELLITEYPVGSVINWHRDALPFDIIIGISLLADCKFQLRPYEKLKQGRGSILNIPVERRSMYVIQGEARMDWQHAIAPVKRKRYSITIRTLKNT